MSVKTEHRTRTSRAIPPHAPARYLVIGQEGSLALGNLLSRVLRLRGLPVEELISFDHRRSLTLYEIEVPGKESAETETVDIMICLNDDSLEYEQLVKKLGTLLYDANSVTRRPTRTDIDVVAVPASSLIQDITEKLTEETRTRFDPSLSSLLGSIEAVESEYPDVLTLKRAFDRLQVGQTGLFLTAVYRGYDWLQETRMRGKTAFGGMLN